jgi:peptidoglycan/LPS O-acetylase OafA/YrhL
MQQEGFFAWMLKGLAADGAGVWASKNIDTVVWCFIMGMGTTAIGAFLRKSDGRTLLYGFLATFVLIGAIIWIIDDYGVRKAFWPLISAAIGGASLVMIGAYIRFMARVEEKLPDMAADAAINRLKGIVEGTKGGT